MIRLQRRDDLAGSFSFSGKPADVIAMPMRSHQNVELAFADVLYVIGDRGHVYPNDPQKYIFGRNNAFPFEQVIPRGIEQVKHQVESSAVKHLPLLITEWSSQNPAFIADTIKSCIGLAEMMSYWTFSNVFEEGGVPSGIFNETFGMVDQYGIARPSLHALAFLHKLGEKRLQSSDGPVLATERADGSSAVLAWNLIPAAEAAAVANGNPMLKPA